MDQPDTENHQKAQSGERFRLVLGLGCDRDTPLTTLLQAIEQTLDSLGADWSTVMAMASIDLKADEAAMQQLMQDKNIPIRFFAAAQLAEVAVPNPSEVVRKYTGTPSVSEAAALLMAGQLEGAEVRAQNLVGAERTTDVSANQSGRLTEDERFSAGRGEGMAGIATALPNGDVEGADSFSGARLSPPAPTSALLIEKHKLRGPDGRNATVSVASVPHSSSALNGGAAKRFAQGGVG